MDKHAVLSSGTHVWRSLACSKSELRLELTLACGQSFRWKETAQGHWTGVMGGRVWTLTQTEDTLWYHVYNNPGGRGRGPAGGSSPGDSESERRLKGAVKKEEEVTDTEEEEQMLRDYLQLSVNLSELYTHWQTVDPHFRQIADIFTGVRMLRQDPTECLFSIICTSNNQISRIQGMVDRLCQNLGAPLCQLEQTSYFDFPSLTALADSSVEACLRDLGFGYRARFLQQSAKQILDTHGLQWLEGLRSVPYLQACDALRTLPGVGTKVANCVCLMSLDKADAVPVDTHIWQIAKRDYNYASGKGKKSITDKLHRDIGDFFRKLWGPYAGWAQSVLFCADLKKFQKLKEMQPKKEEEDEEEIGEESKKTKIKTQANVAVKRSKTKSACHKKAKMSVKKERDV
ncbi:N-glycosylase/DNA lyase-like [Hippoglossus hippoglossus]|uniref:N-glycosylase/DNA lyase-like n=1 Tax=Hippoglossus hippoglossus TaxID=8267 RepID=UPI00148E1D12|nr:N-glycosylase/DNA lyase-like [Hippoglossus hippoglossus]XP_034445826.1 N-glycosylase/DNA lyase-like [Hippoglossus hippoglossus]